ncbi:SMI1/KNR4 family protein [Gorillibacterium sp. CAU 1737]|uniref:SMI1/KNR4 family protein n=1 Tax=Gorillibacterium sp. CAU 1737 TaxID=3140362 RepID=UPI0032618679
MHRSGVFHLNEFHALASFLLGRDRETSGYSEEDIVIHERRLGVSFPPSLRSYYRSFGQCPYLTPDGRNQYEPLMLADLFLPDEDFAEDEKEYLVFYQCAESVIYCGIRLRDLTQEDPPVFIWVWGTPGWHLENRSLRNFLQSKVFIQIALEGKLPYWAFVEESDWNRSDYSRVWSLREDFEEVVEEATILAWKIYLNRDILIVFELADPDCEESILAVHLASFSEESLETLLLKMTQADKSPPYQTNLKNGWSGVK